MESIVSILSITNCINLPDNLKQTIIKQTSFSLQLDLDGDGKFTAYELGVAFEICGEKLPGFTLRDMISQYDVDRNGTLDLSEFIKVSTN